MTRLKLISALFVTMLLSIPIQAQSYLDLSSVTPGILGEFTGTLGGVAVNGSISQSGGSFVFSDTNGSGTSYSNTNNSSPQYSYGNIFTPSIGLTDQVGYIMLAGSNDVTISITFSSPITNPVFHIAGLDQTQWAFSLTGGLTGVSLLSGNGGDGDGFGLLGTTLIDLNPATVVPSSPAIPPLISGPRSAYGSVQLFGNISELTIDVDMIGTADSGNFTLSLTAIPEPSTVLLCGIALLGAGGANCYCRRKQQQDSTELS